VTQRTVLFLNLAGIVGGQEVVMLDIIRRLDPTQYRAVAACVMPGVLVETLEALGVRTYVLPPHRIRQPLRLGRAIRRLARIVADEGVDIVHCNGDTLLFYGVLATFTKRIPCVWHVYEPVATRGPAFVHFVYQTQRRMRPAWTIFGTAAVEESYLKHYPRLGRHSAIMPGVDTDALNTGADADAGRARLGIPKDAPVLLTIARIQRSKGQRELLEALARLEGDFVPPHVVFCGGPPFMTDEDFQEELTARAAALGLTGRIHFTGHVSEAEKKDLLAAATMLVHPAHREAFGIAVIEGMAAGKPVVVTNAVGPRSILAGTTAGEIVAPKDVAALAAALKRRLENPGESRLMGAAGQRHVRERYGTARLVREVERIYRAVLRLPPRTKATRTTPATTRAR
jgi:glycosyltransferase involved in cell wall biosynthesis